jgi:hypothetical protein
MLPACYAALNMPLLTRAHSSLLPLLHVQYEELAHALHTGNIPLPEMTYPDHALQVRASQCSIASLANV